MIRVPEKFKIRDGNIRDVLKQLEELRVDKEERLENASDERAEQLQSEIDELSALIEQATADIKRIEASKAEDAAKKEAAQKAANMVAAGEVTDDEPKKRNIPMVDDGRQTAKTGKSGFGSDAAKADDKKAVEDAKKAADKKAADKKQDEAKAEKERAKADAEHEKELVAKAKALQKEGKKAQDEEDKKAAEDAKKATEEAQKAAAKAAASGTSYTDAMQQGAQAMAAKDYKTANERFSLVANAPTKGKDIPAGDQRAEAMYFLAKIFEQGLGVAVDKKRAFFWYEQSAKLGYVEACKECGMDYTLRKPQNLTDDAENVKMALYYFGLAADKGNADAKTKYIQVCEQRSITKGQLNKALSFCDEFMNAEKDGYIRSQWKDKRDKLKAKFEESPQGKASIAGGGFTTGTAVAMVGCIMTILGCMYMMRAYAAYTNFELLKFNKIPVIGIGSRAWAQFARLYGHEFSVELDEYLFGSALSMFLIGRFFERFAANQNRILKMTGAIVNVFMGFAILFCSILSRYLMGYEDGDYVLLMIFLVAGIGIGRAVTGAVGNKVAGMLHVS